MKVLLFSVLFLLSVIFPPPTFARENSFVSIVNPIRGKDFWDIKDQKPQTAVMGQIEILQKFNFPATWLIRFDALDDQTIILVLRSRSLDEKGLFLEITPSWSREAGVNYHDQKNWHSAGSAFLTGYERPERKKIIDTAFEKFKNIFGSYPVSVGAWWIDSYSLDYMQKKYGIISALMVSDQYSTDNYQIWGQYFSTAYYPSKNNALHPAQNQDSKLNVVMMQWAPRDPVNSYGKGVEESTFSVQANDYIDYHNLDTSYFTKLVDLYTKQPLNQFDHLVVGLENSYSWEKYSHEYQNQMKVLLQKQNAGEFSIRTMKDFALWYKNKFPDLSPEQIIIADDPLGLPKKAVWFMNPYFRAGWFYNQDGSVFRDIRQYIDGEEELCFNSRCDSVNFATSATRVLDEVSFGHKWVIDAGKISDLNVQKFGQNFTISYKNEAGNFRKIEFLPRDISVDGKISSIDSAILDATKDQLNQSKAMVSLTNGSFSWLLFLVFFKVFKFLAFLTIGALVPGFFILKRNIFVCLILGLAIVTLVFYVFSLVHFQQGIYLYLFVNLLLFIKSRKQIFSLLSFKFNILLVGLIGAGTVFQNLPTFKNGLNFPYGLGFWGPNTHDGLWHISLINQLMKSVPPHNPILAGEVLKNYHYFYDLLVAVTSFTTGIPILDLLFRFYPITFSLCLGIGSYLLISTLTKQKLSQILSLYLIYFAGSFGWIVDYIKNKSFGGESAFWANQSVSFNLNPPFAISLLMVIAIILLLISNIKNNILPLMILSGLLLAFKAYAAVLIFFSLLITGLFQRNLKYLLVFLFGGLMAAMLFLSNFSLDKQLFIFSPFWFIHSMIDSPDRVGWMRLSLARTAGLEQGNWFKFLAVEAISLVLFIVGNLGTRVMGLLNLRSNLFILIFSLLSLFTPIFFIQAGNPWNTIQFMYYFLYMGAALAGMVLAKIFKTGILGLLLVTALILISPINSWASANGYLSSTPHAFVGNQELAALNFLKNKEGVVLTYPYDEKLKVRLVEPWPLLAYDSTSYVSALSGREVFVEDEPQNQILLTDYKKRLVAAKDFFLRPDPEEANFLHMNHIKYIYLPKIYNIRLSENHFIKNIFENSEVIIYGVQ